MGLPASRWVELLGFALFYMAVARLSMRTLGADGIAVVWPASGLSLSVLLLRGSWLWPGIVLGAMGANLLAGFPPLLALALGFANALETLLAIFLMVDVAGSSPRFDRFRDLFSLGLASLLATPVGALLAGVSFLLLGPPGVQPLSVALTWWAADQLSIWLMTPAVLVVMDRRGLPHRTWGRRLEMAVSYACLLWLGWNLFWRPFRMDLFSLPFLVFPLLVWLALRTGSFGTVLGNLLLGALAVGGTLARGGVFGGMEKEDSRVSLQVFLGAAPLTSLVLALVTEERQRNAERARRSEQWLQASLKAAHAAIWEWDVRGQRMLRSSNHDALFGWPQSTEDWGRESFLLHIHPEDRERIAAEFDRALRERTPYTPEFRVRWPDGSIHWLATQSTPRMDSGVFHSLGGVVMDITWRKQQEQALAESERRFRLMADTAPVLLWMSEPDKGFNYFNRPWLDFTGQTLEQQRGEGWAASVHPEDRSRCLESHATSFAAHQSFELEYRLRRHDGTYHWLLEHGVPRFAGESLVGYLGACVDIQRLKEAEALLRERSHTLADLNQELARSNADLEQFAYVTSHDLREPIRMVLSYGELLRHRYGERLDDKGLKYLGYMVEGASRLQELVSDLLAYSRAGRANQRPVPTNLEQVLASVRSSLRQALSESQARLTSAPLPTLEAFPSQLEVLFQNLIENAVKFRRAVPPEIHVDARELPEGWEFEVRDNGIGIEPPYLERIFGLFQRLHSRQEYPGTGMGLAICKRIVERHGGHVWASSTPGVGTSIHFILPRHMPQPISQGAAPS
ncbi:MAG TPA: PAS domain-containing protein [Archangium sp.]|uniref:PAS domain-containing protein n=1 Tax=Archangium sp. TaxID=1872627 RepID=UPI002E33A973|nr:PAS domain-containing protein [Archangium sp.]HEX5748840.1 PAS domain-containing protein [Archangium sp.]